MSTPLTAVNIELVADSRLDAVARDPDVSPAPVRVLVALNHTSAARVPNEVSVLDPLPHTAVAAAEAIVEVE